MTNRTSAARRRSWWRGALAAGTLSAALALLWLAVVGWRAAGEAARGDEEDVRREHCRTIARVAGPEDVVDDAAHGRLLISAVDRRADPARDGGIWRISYRPPQPPPEARRMPLAGRDGCSFRPQGIDLVAVAGAGGSALLYVLNHHDPADSRPDSRCFDSDDRPYLPSPDAGRGATSIEVFAVEEDRLSFLRRLAAPAALTGGNDLVALPGGDIWVTVPPGGSAAVAEGLGLGFHSRLVHFDCRGTAPGCAGTWRSLVVPPVEGALPRFTNGIAWRAADDPDHGGELFVASTMAGGVFVYRLDAEGDLRAAHRLGRHVVGPDNLTWLDDGRKVLLTAAHPSSLRFLRHHASAAVTSPSRAWRIDLDRSGSPQPIFRDSGRRISAASTALCVEGELVLGQVFGGAVEACRPHPPLGCAPAPAGSEEAR
jgi:hypothetical protein